MMNGTSPNSMNAPHALPPSPNSKRQEIISRKHSSNNRFAAAMEKPNPDPNPNPGHYDMSKTQQIAVPTTFVQADTNNFRELVQKLTGISDDTREKLPITMPARHSSRPTAAAVGSTKQVSDGGIQATIGLGSKSGGVEVGPRKSAFKLQERRQNMRKLEIKLGLTSLRHNQYPGSALSPSPRGEIRSIDLPALVPSPVTPLGSDPFSYTPTTTPNSSNAAVVSSIYGPPTPTAESISDEERAIAEKGFYLHPSPLNTPRGPDPELLTLFPLHSPKQSSS